MRTWLRWLYQHLSCTFSNEAGMATLNVSIETTDWSGTTPTIWEEALYHVSTRTSIGDKLSGGPNSGMAIIDKFELTGRAGQTITFTMVNPLVAEGVSGRSTLVNSEEDTEATTFSLSTTRYRQATATDEQAKLVSVFGRKWDTEAGKLLADWFARRKDDDWMNQALNLDTIETIYAGGQSITARNNIPAGAYLTPQELRKLHMRAQRRGAHPVKTVHGMKNTYGVYCVVLSEVDWYNLFNNEQFRQDVRLGAERGQDNPALSGQIDRYNNMLLLSFSSRPANTGFMGTFLRPEARLRTALTAAATTVDIGAATQKSNTDYGKYFPGSGATNLLQVDSEIISYAGGASDPGNTGWATVSRAAGGTTATIHSAGAYITLRNLGKVLCFGQNLVLRGWSMKPKRIEHKWEDYGNEHGIGIDWMYGLESVQYSDGVANGVVMETYSANAWNA